MTNTNDFSAYFTDPSAFYTPAGYGQVSGGNNNQFLNYALGQDPVTGFNPMDPSGIVGGLFGGDKPSWKPYVDKNGNYVWSDPSKNNPVPIASTPGASLKPSKQYLDMAKNIQAITDLLPFYSKAVAGQVIPQAQAQLEAAKATSGGYNQLMLDLYRQFGPQLNQVGNDIAKQNALASAERDKSVLEGPGKDLVRQALETAKIYDPEYFKSREITSNRLNDLLQSIDLGSGLTGSERAEIERSQAQEGTRRGTYNAPSSLDTVSNAMQFGNAGFQRLQQNRSALSTAIANATAALPTFKSGVDVFQVATGKSSQNSGENKFTGIDKTAYDNAASLANGLMNNTVSTQQNNAQLALQEKLGTKDWADYLGQVTSSIGNLGSVAGGAMAMCWIARKVYGEHNPKWLLFRSWLLTKASNKIKDFYLQYGSSIASKMNNKEIERCKVLMNNILKEAYYV